MKPRIAVTLGDPAGIGPEIVSVAIQDARVRAACDPVLVGDPVAFALHRQPLPRAELLSVPGLNRRLPLGRPSPEAGRSALESLNKALALIQGAQAEALVTAPVSKESFHAAGLRVPGHTEWLAERSGAKSVGMLMVAGNLRALLMTRHVALRQVSQQLTSSVLQESARLAHNFVRNYLRKKPPRIVLCGLNPHAGEGGIIGNEEKRIFQPALKALRSKRLPVEGPFSADAVFPAMARNEYDLALATYHDQGMIPLKLFAGQKMVNVTLGLPWVRTSPGHGTAFDIAGKKRAKAGPMIEAILLAAQYARA